MLLQVRSYGFHSGIIALFLLGLSEDAGHVADALVGRRTHRLNPGFGRMWFQQIGGIIQIW
jgi:hypothetical protein